MVIEIAVAMLKANFVDIVNSTIISAMVLIGKKRLEYYSSVIILF